MRSLLTLGITGGALPCPSALVVMLSAIALHRVAFGLALILFFSLGLASVLTALGILVVRLRSVIARGSAFATRGAWLLPFLPIFSAALVTAVGVILLVRAFMGQF